MLMTVYAPTGEIFEVHPFIAKRMVIEAGCSIDGPILPIVAPKEKTSFQKTETVTGDTSE